MSFSPSHTLSVAHHNISKKQKKRNHHSTAGTLISITFHTKLARAALDGSVHSSTRPHSEEVKEEFRDFRKKLASRVGFFVVISLWKKWRVLLPIPFAVWKQWLPVCCAVGKRQRQKKNTGLASFCARVKVLTHNVHFQLNQQQSGRKEKWSPLDEKDNPFLPLRELFLL